MQGYMTLAVEAYEQLAETNSPLPTHLILQAGWDHLLAVLWVILLKNAGKYPNIIVVEPHQANCLYQSAVMNDGQPHCVTGDMATIMAGLACGSRILSVGLLFGTTPVVLFPLMIVWRLRVCAFLPRRVQYGYAFYFRRVRSYWRRVTL